MIVPSALSIHNFVNSVGAYVGLGSILAVALLVLLYFAHARETATLRDRLEEAQHRIGGLEGRVAQLMQAQAAAARRVPGPAPVTPAPASVRPAVAPAPAGRKRAQSGSGRDGRHGCCRRLDWWHHSPGHRPAPPRPRWRPRQS